MNSFILRPKIFPLTFAFYAGVWDSRRAQGLARQAELIGGRTSLESPAPGHAACTYNFNDGSLIWMPGIPRTPKEYGLLVHEIVHAIGNSGDVLGFKLTRDSDEFYSYLAQWLTTQALTNFKK
jgi:hypothetical protein